VSLVLSSGIAAIWVRSYWSADLIAVTPSSWTVAMASLRGRVMVACQPMGFKALFWYDSGTATASDAASLDEKPWRFRAWVFAFGIPDSSGHAVMFPHAAIVLPVALLPVWWLLRRRSRDPGACPACGYDLRGTPGSPGSDSGAGGGGGRGTSTKTCPECGFRGASPSGGDHGIPGSPGSFGPSGPQQEGPADANVR
jgi:hypothetical protein